MKLGIYDAAFYEAYMQRRTQQALDEALAESLAEDLDVDALEQATASLAVVDEEPLGPNLLEELPAELFNKIISFVYAEHLLVLPYDKYHPSPTALDGRKVFVPKDYPEFISPLLVNKRFAAEGSKALFRNMTCFFFDWANPRFFLPKIGAVNCANIRSVEVCLPGSRRRRRVTYDDLKCIAEQLPHINRLRVHIKESMHGAKSPYVYSLYHFCKQMHLKELRIAHYSGRQGKALQWVSNKPFTSSEVEKMLDSGCISLTRRADQHYLPADEAVLATATTLHASKIPRCCGVTWEADDELVEKFDLGLEEKLSCRLH